MVLLDLTYANVLSKTTKMEVMEAFFGTSKIYGCFSSPLRKDEHPSFSVSKRTGRYTDHVTKENGDAFDLIMKYNNVDHIGALKIAVNLVGISHLFNISDTNVSYKSKPEIKGFISGNDFGEVLDLNVVVREWTQDDLDYWGQYNINIDIINLGKIKPISAYYLNELRYVADKYSYVYAEKKDGKVTLKVYQPFREIGKWINNNPYDVWELFYLIPKKGKYLIINSSRKDSLAVIANLGIPSTAMQAEGILPKPQVLDEVVGRFDAVFVLYDNDKKDRNWGQENAEKLLAMNKNLINIKIPDRFEAKDFTDLITEIGAYSATMVLRSVINDAIIENKDAIAISRSKNR